MFLDVAFCLFDERENGLQRSIIALEIIRPRTRQIVGIEVGFQDGKIKIAALAPHGEIFCRRVEILVYKINKFVHNVLRSFGRTGEHFFECRGVLLSPPSESFGIIVKAFVLAFIVVNLGLEIYF